MLSTPLDQYKLARYPRSKDPSLKAWNAADEYLVQSVGELINSDFEKGLPHTLIINDQFGALTLSFNALLPYLVTDSCLSLTAITKNLQANLDNFNSNKFYENNVCTIELFDKNGQVKLTSCKNDLEQKTKFDLVIIRIPKHNSLLEYQLQAIKPCLTAQTRIVAGGMTKEIHNSTLQIFENNIGPTKTSLAKKKARLIFSQFTQQSAIKTDIKSFELKTENLKIIGLPGVFSREKLDLGARVLLDYLPELDDNQLVADLGCGNGVLGATMAKRYPTAKIVLCDESALAINSAKLTFAENNLANGRFYQTDVFKDVQEKDFDLILCNPPFHQQNVQTLAIANQMFLQSAQKLNSKGELRVVANRHLKYGPGLRRYFEQVSAISDDKRFIVWSAKSPKNQPLK